MTVNHINDFNGKTMLDFVSKMLDFVLKMLDFVANLAENTAKMMGAGDGRDDEFCSNNARFVIENVGFCTENLRFCIENVGFCTENLRFCIEHVGFCREALYDVHHRSGQFHNKINILQSKIKILQ